MIVFSVPGKPQPWRRARKSGKNHYKDAKTKAYQGEWGYACRMAMGPVAPIEGPVSVSVVAHFAIPKRASKAARTAMLSGAVRPTCTPDADNIAKNLDSLNGIAFADDAQIVSLTVSKRYGEAPGVSVAIEPLEAA